MNPTTFSPCLQNRLLAATRCSNLNECNPLDRPLSSSILRKCLIRVKEDDAGSVMGNALPHPEKLEMYQSWT